jgi:hypothetical protein
MVRTTVTLDPDVDALIREVMREQGIGFKEALNQAVRTGLSPRRRVPFRQRTFALGFRPGIPYEKTLQLAAELESQELLRKAELGK